MDRIKRKWRKHRWHNINKQMLVQGWHEERGHVLKDVNRQTNKEDKHTHNDWSNSLPLQQRVSSTPVLDPLLPFLPTGKVILSTPSETNAYITTELQTNCSCYNSGLLNVCMFVWLSVCALETCPLLLVRMHKSNASRSHGRHLNVTKNIHPTLSCAQRPVQLMYSLWSSNRARQWSLLHYVMCLLSLHPEDTATGPSL